MSAPGITAPNDVRDLTLSAAGRRRLEWVFQSMPVLQSVRKQFIRSQPLAGLRVSACFDVTPEAANLMVTLRDGGAEVVLAGANSKTTQDDVAAALVKEFGIAVFAVRDASAEARLQHIEAALDHRPHLTLEDGAALVTAIHSRRSELAEEVVGGVEESSAGAAKFRVLAAGGMLPYPVVAAGDSLTKHLFDNRYGAGQSTIDALVRSTNLLLAGLNVVIAGYGWCGRGCASQVKGMGANVTICETDPLRALEAVMDGHRVTSMTEAAAYGDLFLTATGNRNVIARDHFERMRNGAVLANAGHSNVEIDVEGLARMASSHKPAGEFVEEFATRDGRKLYLLCEGRVANTAAGGQPTPVLDMSFSSQALAAEFLVKSRGTLEKRVYSAPPELDRYVARMKLDAMGVKTDRLSYDQEQYLAGKSGQD